MPLPCAMSMRRLVGWESIRYELAQYIEKQVQARCFEVGEDHPIHPVPYGWSCVQRTWMMRGCSLRAVRYPSLHPAMERHARLAMREYEWYNNLSDEFYAMPGPFAVFALGLEGCTPGYLGPGV